MGRLYAYTYVDRSQYGPYPRIVIVHSGNHKISHGLSRADFPELYQLLFPIVLSPRMERIMEATSRLTGANAEREGRDW